ncbi:hypothetical protein MMC26_005365 [Xylographa opegraphella]|nr:hypothetical protein [Xylographa opegraphella]
MDYLPKLGSLPPMHDVIVPEEDHRTFAISHPDHLKLYASPLATQEDMHHVGHIHDNGHGEPHEHNSHHNHSISSSSTEHAVPDMKDPDVPILKRAHEASTIQLFFDLFFVANLTTFTSLHEINTWTDLSSYVGYFAVIWFTWLQNTLFDVRFSNDSAYERMCKLLQFGVMTGFAITGPGYNTAWANSQDAANSILAFRALSLILMSSRLILTFQYGVAFFLLRSYKKAFVPMAAHMAVLFASAMLFLGMSFAFTRTSSEKVLIGWYLIVAAEALAISMISGQVNFLSFRATVIVERLGLLTLIVLGEGIIGMCEAINKIGSDNVYSADIIGTVICSVGILYFMWMLYFDQIAPDRMGTIREHIWVILHFPFHVCVILVVEGLSRLSVWRKLTDVTSDLQTTFTNVPQNLKSEDLVNYIDTTLNRQLNNFTSFQGSDIGAPDFSQFYDQILQADGNKTAITEGVNGTFISAVGWVCRNLKVDVPDSSSGNEIDFVNSIYSSFTTVFIYFFTFAGFVLILLAVLFLLGKRRKLRGELLAVCVRAIFGIAISLLALMAVPAVATKDNSAYNAYMFSAWMLPTILICYLTVIVIDNLLIRYIHQVVKWRSHLHIKGYDA